MQTAKNTSSRRLFGSESVRNLGGYSALGEVVWRDEASGATGKTSIVQSQCTIGSSPDSTVVLPESIAASMHAQLVFGKRFVLLKASYPTRIQGKLVKEWLIDKPTAFQIGSIQLEVIPFNGSQSGVALVRSNDLVSTANRMSSPSPNSRSPLDAVRLEEESQEPKVPDTIDVVATRFDTIEESLRKLQEALVHVQDSIATPEESSVLTETLSKEIQLLGERITADIESRWNVRMDQDTHRDHSVQLSVVNLGTRIEDLSNRFESFAGRSEAQHAEINSLVQSSRESVAQLEQQLESIRESRDALLNALEAVRVDLQNHGATSQAAFDHLSQLLQYQPQSYGGPNQLSDINSDGAYGRSVAQQSSVAGFVDDASVSSALEQAHLELNHYNRQIKEIDQVRQDHLLSSGFVEAESAIVPPSSFDSGSTVDQSAGASDGYANQAGSGEGYLNYLPYQNQSSASSFPQGNYQDRDNSYEDSGAGWSSLRSPENATPSERTNEFTSPSVQPNAFGDSTTPGESYWSQSYPNSNASVPSGFGYQSAGNEPPVAGEQWGSAPSAAAPYVPLSSFGSFEASESVEHGEVDPYHRPDDTYSTTAGSQESLGGYVQDAAGDANAHTSLPAWFRDSERTADDSYHNASPVSESEYGIDALRSIQRESLPASAALREVHVDDSFSSDIGSPSSNSYGSEADAPPAYSPTQPQRISDTNLAESFRAAPLGRHGIDPQSDASWKQESATPAVSSQDDDDIDALSERLKRMLAEARGDAPAQELDRPPYAVSDAAEKSQAQLDEEFERRWTHLRMTTEKGSASNDLSQPSADRKGVDPQYEQPSDSGPAHVPASAIASRNTASGSPAPWSQSLYAEGASSTIADELLKNAPSEGSYLNGASPEEDEDDNVQDYGSYLSEQLARSVSASLKPSDAPEVEPLDEVERESSFANTRHGIGSKASNDDEDDSDAQGGGEEESIEAYMQKLLQRVKGGGDSGTLPAPTETVKQAPRSRMEILNRGQAPAREASGASLALGASTTNVPEERMPNLTAGEFIPRQQVPEHKNDLNALRELANINARRAIHRSETKRTSSAVLFKISITALAVASAGVLFLMNGFKINPPFAGMVAAIIVAVLWGYDCMIHFRRLEKSRQSTADNDQHEADNEEAAALAQKNSTGWRPTPA